MQSEITSKWRARVWPTVLLVSALCLFAGCSDVPVVTQPGLPSETAPSTPTTPTTPAASGPLRIWGVMTPQNQSIRVSRAGAPITDASVTVNGIPIPHFRGELYSGGLPASIPDGGTLTLKVVADRVNFEASGEVIWTPVITSPAAGTSVAFTDSVSLQWSMPTDPDYFDVCLNCLENSLDGEVRPVPGSAREFNISPRAVGLVDYGTGAVVAVYAYKKDFLKYEGSPEVTSDVLFVGRSRDLLFTIKY